MFQKATTNNVSLIRRIYSQHVFETFASRTVGDSKTMISAVRDFENLAVMVVSSLRNFYYSVHHAMSRDFLLKQ